jgi:hypothetical protein
MDLGLCALAVLAAASTVRSRRRRGSSQRALPHPRGGEGAAASQGPIYRLVRRRGDPVDLRGGIRATVAVDFAGAARRMDEEADTAGVRAA